MESVKSFCILSMLVITFFLLLNSIISIADQVCGCRSMYICNTCLYFSRNLFEKVKTDIRLMKEEQSGLERTKQPKERSLTQLKANLEAMMATKEGLESELHQELMATLSVQVRCESRGLSYSRALPLRFFSLNS